jgi:hypothetical protein
VTHWRDYDHHHHGGVSPAAGGPDIPLANLLRNHAQILARDRRNHYAAAAVLALGALLWGLLCGAFGGAGAGAAAVDALSIGGGGKVVGAAAAVSVEALPPVVVRMASTPAVAAAAAMESVVVPVASSAPAGKVERIVSDAGEGVDRVFSAQGGYSAAQSNVRLETFSFSQPEIVISPAE